MGKSLIIPGVDFSSTPSQKSFAVTDITASAHVHGEHTQAITYMPIGPFTSSTPQSTLFNQVDYACLSYKAEISANNKIITIDVSAYQGKILRETASYKQNENYACAMWWKWFAIKKFNGVPETITTTTFKNAHLVAKFCDEPVLKGYASGMIATREWRIPENATIFVTSNRYDFCPNPSWQIIDG